jgi:hypothetical protein
MLSPASPEVKSCAGDNGYRKHPTGILQRGFECRTKQISQGTDGCHPGNRAQSVEDQKTAPGHAQHSRQGSGEETQSRDEAGKENCDCSAAQHQLLALLNDCRAYVKNMAITHKQRSSSMPSNCKPKIIPARGRGNRDSSNHKYVQLVAARGQCGCNDEDCLSGNRDASTFQHDPHQNGPVAPMSEAVLELACDPLLHANKVQQGQLLLP